MVSLKEIAKKANVSTSTASFILNGKGDQMRIAKKTQEKVLAIAKELGYHPNIFARRLRKSENESVPIIAILWTLDMRASLINRFLGGIQSKINNLEQNFELLIIPYENNKIHEITALLSGDRFNGAIIANASEHDLVFLESGYISVPVVVYQRSSRQLPTVSVDSFKTGEMIAEHFYKLNKKKVAILQPTIFSPAIEKRKSGFLSFFKSKSIEIDNHFIMNEDFGEKGGYRCAKKMVELSHLPEAVFCLSDTMAIGFVRGLYESDIHVPKDIFIVGHDNNESMEYLVPSITSVHLPVEEMAFECVRTLLNLNNQREENEMIHKMFETKIIFRESCPIE